MSKSENNKQDKPVKWLDSQPDYRISVKEVEGKNGKYKKLYIFIDSAELVYGISLNEQYIKKCFENVDSKKKKAS